MNRGKREFRKSSGKNEKEDGEWEGYGDGKVGRTGDEWERGSRDVKILGFGPIKIGVVMLTQPSFLSFYPSHTLLRLLSLLTFRPQTSQNTMQYWSTYKNVLLPFKSSLRGVKFRSFI